MPEEKLRATKKSEKFGPTAKERFAKRLLKQVENKKKFVKELLGNFISIFDFHGPADQLEADHHEQLEPTGAGMETERI